MNGGARTTNTALERVQGVFLWAGESIGRRTAVMWLAVVTLEAILLVAYFALTSNEPTGEFRYLVYPFIWINAAIFAFLRISPAVGSRAHTWLARAVAVGYFLLLMWIPGLIGPGTVEPGHLGLGLDNLRIGWYAPGWGPLIAYSGAVRLFLVPFEVIGYAGLSYLVYANVLTLTRSLISGILGLVTCVGCTVPVLAPLVGLLGGPASSLTTTAYAWSYDIGTLVFLLAIGLLFWSHRRNRA